VGVLLPTFLASTKAMCENFCAAVAAAAAVGPVTVLANVTMCKRWVFSRRTGIEGLCKWLGECSLEKLKILVSDKVDEEWVVDSAHSKDH
jgi:hypothetical protein